MTSTCKTGEDLLVKILVILPPKTLMRFKCVAKWWYALINNPMFVDKHLSNSMDSNQSSTCVFMKRVVPKGYPNTNNETDQSVLLYKDAETNIETELVFSKLTFSSVVDDGNGGAHSVLSNVEDINVPTSMSLMTGGESSLSIVGHCHGIVCLALANSSKLFLWNPAIQEFKLLPLETYLPVPDWSSLGSQDVSYLPAEDRLKSAKGVGYDPISKAYKVVNIRFSGAEIHGHKQHLIIYPLKVEVYTLGTDSWREINTYSLETETTFLWPERFQFYFKGMSYWLGNEQHKEFIDLYDTVFQYPETEKIRRVIISFDTSREVFHDVLLPAELLKYNNDEDYLEMRLTVWNESIALFGLCGIASPEPRYSEPFGLWLMDDFGGGKGSVWTKYLAFEFALDETESEWSLGLWKSNEFLVVSLSGCIICYNLRTKESTYLPIQSGTKYSGDNEVPDYVFPIQGYIENNGPVVYTNSIVSVLGGNNPES